MRISGNFFERFVYIYFPFFFLSSGIFFLLNYNYPIKYPIPEILYGSIFLVILFFILPDVLVVILRKTKPLKIIANTKEQVMIGKKPISINSIISINRTQITKTFYALKFTIEQNGKEKKIYVMDKPTLLNIFNRESSKTLSQLYSIFPELHEKEI